MSGTLPSLMASFEDDLRASLSFNLDSNFGENTTCDIWDRSWYSANHLLIDIHNDDTKSTRNTRCQSGWRPSISIALRYATEICISPFPQRFSDLAQFTDTKKIEGLENLKTRPRSKLRPPEVVNTFELTSLLWHQYVQGYLSLRTGPPEAPHVKTSNPVTYRARTGPDTNLTLFDLAVNYSKSPMLKSLNGFDTHICLYQYLSCNEKPFPAKRRLMERSRHPQCFTAVTGLIPGRRHRRKTGETGFEYRQLFIFKRLLREHSTWYTKRRRISQDKEQ
ncbi:hypothetical protein EDD18DRAFT_1109662 [Armillaria luteobubalina]|uniref:Uncharacterized protein n=1 Tax=Armillaria luteobubalina TaxID=153913 RepID=A0AA39UJC8_9AGAR|nr:hypothetical protein EDD18DRAFT_1109662 [Armillaria luteobubalina]